MITKEELLKHLDCNLSVAVYDTLDSTNLAARAMAASPCEDTLIVALRQTAGRGRMGRSFFSPTGGIYMSLLIHPGSNVATYSGVTAAAAVAVARAIDKVSGKKCDIKWVNDIYLDNRKVCGILAEAQVASTGEMEFVIVGIGINLTPPKGGFPKDIANLAGAVFETLHDGADAIIAVEAVNEFMRLYRGGFRTWDILPEYRMRSNIVGREVDVFRRVGGAPKSAKALAIDEDFRLVVRYPDGTEEAIGAGEVSVRGK